MKVPFTYSSTESTVKNVTYSLPWKIPREVDSSIISGLTSTVEDEGVSNQHSDTIWGDLHIIKNKSCKMETDIRRMKHRNQHESLFFYFNEQTWQKKKDKRLTLSRGNVHWHNVLVTDHSVTGEHIIHSVGTVGNLESHLWIPYHLLNNLLW